METLVRESPSNHSYQQSGLAVEEEEYESEDEQLVPPPRSWFEAPTTGSASQVLESDGASPGNVDGLTAEVNPTQLVSLEIGNETIVGLDVRLNPSHYAPLPAVGHTHPSPSWKEISSQVLPAAARELLCSSFRRICYTARLSYATSRWHRKYSDIGNNSGGFFVPAADFDLPVELSALPPFSSLPWVDRQLVKEWRTYLPDSLDDMQQDEDFDFDRARTLVPRPMERPRWRKADVCHECHKPFGPTRLRHHCRLCGNSYCQSHSSLSHSLPHLGYDPEVPERVCDSCKRLLLEQNLAERVAWRLARCRDFSNDTLTPYFETGLDSAHQVALRITQAALAMARSIPLGAQATVAVETVDVLRQHGLTGIYGIMLRKEFLAAADLLRRALGINQESWPLSVHELSAAIFYALAQHRAMRGLDPEREELIHSFRPSSSGAKNNPELHAEEQNDKDTTSSEVPSGPGYEMANPVFYDDFDLHHDRLAHCDPGLLPPAAVEVGRYGTLENKTATRHVTPVCEPVSDPDIASLMLYAPIALNFIYATKEVDMQILAAQQGWQLVYAFLDQDVGHAKTVSDRPVSALFVHEEHRVACLSVRGTASIQDVITDIRQTPVPFPECDIDKPSSAEKDEGWTSVFRGQGIALCGMASAAVNLFREHIDSLLFFARRGYRIRLTGHSLGGGVATMIGVLLLRHFKRDAELYQTQFSCASLEDRDFVRVYAYGSPSCVDSELADFVNSFVTTVILHDDVVPRLTPMSCRGLLKHLLHIRETWVKSHLTNDLMAIRDRAKTVWAPRFRHDFTLSSRSRSIKQYCRKKIQYGKRRLLSVKGKMVGQGGKDEDSNSSDGRTGAPGDTSSTDSWASSSNSFMSPQRNTDENADGEDRGVELTESRPQLLLEFLGGGDNNTQGILIDGDEFFDTEEKLVESEEDFSQAHESFEDPLSLMPDEALGPSDSWSLDIQSPRVQHSAAKSPRNDGTSEIGPAPVFLEETPLPRMFVPGKVIHIYSHRGVYKAAYVPRTFRELRRISLAGNMLWNHGTRAYFEGIQEVQTARVAPEGPPKWTAFDEDDTCCCCASRFTWASTSDSEAQEARDKHNCRSCGGLVCDPCAKKRAPIPSIGVTVPVRVCDRCYNDMGGLSNAPSSATSSFLAVEDDDTTSPGATSPGRFSTPFQSDPDMASKIPRDA